MFSCFCLLDTGRGGAVGTKFRMTLGKKFDVKHIIDGRVLLSNLFLFVF